MIPVESKGAAKSYGFPLDQAMLAMMIIAPHRAIYKIMQRQSLHLLCSEGPCASSLSRAYPLY